MASFLKKVLSLSRQYSPSGHNHDERYYTEAEVNALLRNVKAPVNPAQGMPDFLNAKTLEDQNVNHKTNPIWKCNVPGYLYYWIPTLKYQDMDYCIAAANNVNDLKSGSTILASNKATVLYHNYVDGGASHIIMYPIVPGTSTYFRLMRQEAQKAVLFFLPAVGINGKIASSNWCTNAGSGNGTYTSGSFTYFFGTVKSSIFAGDWKDNFPSVTWCHQVTESICKFIAQLFVRNEEVCYG